ncbi:MAG: RIP metalloprotease RseP [Bacteroidaceae bacterium]|nr:RIP metalloprotease RseP [Bacteroidaceae bacterium]
MEVFLIKTLQLICCLSLLIVLHEGGHYGFSKLFGVRVEKFYMFFNYKFHLFSTRDGWFTRLFPYFKDNETEYGIGWIPLGGYVKIAGMVDESMDMEQMKQPAQPDEFRSQKVWKRFFIMFGGVLMNFLTAWFIYSAMLFTWGRDYVPMQSIENGFQFNEVATEIGFQNGDLPIAADGETITEYNGNLLRLIAKSSTMTVLRDGEEVTITMPEGGLSLLELVKMQPAFLTPFVLADIDSVFAGSPAEAAGLRKGCRLMKVNGYEILTWADYEQDVTLRLNDVLSAKDCTAADSLRMHEMTIVYMQPDHSSLDTVTITTGDDYMLGVMRTPFVHQIEHQDFSFLSSIPAGLRKGWTTMTSYVSDLRYVASAEGAKSVGSFVTIGNLFPSLWDWQAFWSLTAFISIILAVMNILPIPGLDGGHIAILLYEAVTGHEPSERFMEWAEKIGIGLLILLMLLAFSNDARNFILPLFGL